MPNFMDEPTVGLDVIARDEVLNMLREYMEENESSCLFSCKYKKQCYKH